MERERETLIVESSKSQIKDAPLADIIYFFSPSNPKGIRILDHTPHEIEDMYGTGERSEFLISYTAADSIELGDLWEDNHNGKRQEWNMRNNESLIVDRRVRLLQINPRERAPQRVKTIMVSDKTFKKIQERIAKPRTVEYNDKEYLVIDLGTKVREATSTDLRNIAIDKKYKKYKSIKRAKAISRWKKYKEKLKLEDKKYLYADNKIPTDTLPDDFNKTPKKRG